METFKVMNPDGTPEEGKENKEPNFSLSAILTKDAFFGGGAIDSVDGMLERMNKIDTMFIPKGFPPPADITMNDKDALFLGVP